MTQDDIVSGFEGPLQQTVSQAKAGVRAQQGISRTVIVRFDVFERILHPFIGIETAFKKEQHFKTNLGLVVSIMYNTYSLPQEIQVG